MMQVCSNTCHPPNCRTCPSTFFVSRKEMGQNCNQYRIYLLKNKLSFCYNFINILFIHDKIPFVTCLSKLLVYHQSLNFERVLKLVLKIEDKNVRFENSYLLQFYPKTCLNHLNKQNPFICYIFNVCESFVEKRS